MRLVFVIRFGADDAGRVACLFFKKFSVEQFYEYGPKVAADFSNSIQHELAAVNASRKHRKGDKRLALPHNRDLVGVLALCCGNLVNFSHGLDGLDGKLIQASNEQRRLPFIQRLFNCHVNLCRIGNLFVSGEVIKQGRPPIGLFNSPTRWRILGQRSKCCGQIITATTNWDANTYQSREFTRRYNSLQRSFNGKYLMRRVEGWRKPVNLLIKHVLEIIDPVRKNATQLKHIFYKKGSCAYSSCVKNFCIELLKNINKFGVIYVFSGTYIINTIRRRKENVTTFNFIEVSYFGKIIINIFENNLFQNIGKIVRHTVVSLSKFYVRMPKKTPLRSKFFNIILSDSREAASFKVNFAHILSAQNGESLPKSTFLLLPIQCCLGSQLVH